ncbi:MAG: hypothetical protein JSS68_14995 [Actinobacteria bacterium]|nr:hypothetical protein [Actinomycetota bacterium]
MTELTFNLPELHEARSGADPKIREGLLKTKETVNGNLDSSNIKSGGVTTVNLAESAITEPKIANEAVSLAKMQAAAKNTFTTTAGNTSGPKLGRGSFAAEVVQPGGQFEGQAFGYVNHGMGATPVAINITPFIALNYGVLFNFRIFENNSTYFGWQVYSTQMPSERVTISAAWIALT